MSIFVLTLHDHELHVFADAAAALASDVVKSSKGKEDLLFFADDGSGLRRECGNGVDYLRPWASCSACSLSQVVHLVVAVRGEPPLDSRDAVRRYMKMPLA